MINSDNKGKLVTAFAQAKMDGLDKRISEPLLKMAETIEVLIDERLEKLEEEFYKTGKSINSSIINIKRYKLSEVASECLKNSEGYQKLHQIVEKRNIAIKIRKLNDTDGIIFIDLSEFYENSEHLNVHKNSRFKVSKLKSSNGKTDQKSIVIKAIPNLKK